MPRFDRRDQRPEMMDDLSITDARLTRALEELRFVDALLGGSRTSLAALTPVLSPGGTARVLDVGCGGGEFVVALARWASGRARAVAAVGVDLNPETVAFAQHRLDRSLTPAERACVSVQPGDARALPFPDGHFDVAHAGLFLHHFDDEAAVQVLRELGRVAHVVVVNDLHRHPVAYYAIDALARLLSASPMFRADAPHSVLRGFHRSELAHLAARAGLHGAIEWKWAFRWIAVLS